VQRSLPFVVLCQHCRRILLEDVACYVSVSETGSLSIESMRTIVVSNQPSRLIAESLPCAKRSNRCRPCRRGLWARPRLASSCKDRRRYWPPLRGGPLSYSTRVAVTLI
jgi:hypothetical protein